MILEFTPRQSNEPIFGSAVEDSPDIIRREEQMPGFSSQFHQETSPETPSGPISHREANEASPDMLQSPTWLLSEILQSISPKDIGPEHDLAYHQAIIDNGNKLVDLLIQYPQLKYEVILQLIINKVNFMFYSDLSEIRSLGYRILKYCIINEDSLLTVVQNKVLIFLIISLSTDHSSDLEKLYAIKLIHQFLSIPNGTTYLSIGVIKLLIVLLDDEGLFIINNQLKHLIMEILLEITISNPQLVYHSNGFNLLINNLTSNQDAVIQLNSLIVIIKLLELSDYKFYFRNGYNLMNLISIFDETHSEASDGKKFPTQKFHNISFLLTVFLKNWNGLICSSLNDFSFVKNLIEHLYNPNLLIKEFILDILLDILRIQALPWLKDSKIGEFLLKFNPHADFQYDSGDFYRGDGSASPIGSDNDYKIITHYLNHFQGLLTFILVQLNLIDILVNNLNHLQGQYDDSSESFQKFSSHDGKYFHDNTTQWSEHSNSVANKIILLLTNLFKFSKIYLPSEFNLDLSNKVQLGSLIQMGNLCLNFDPNSYKLKYGNPNYNPDLSYLNTQMNNLKLYKNSKVLLKHDDNVDLKNLINNTKVLTVKDFNEWEWDRIYGLFQNHLKLEKRFMEVLERQPKFFKRLLSFYRPFKFRFCNLAVKSAKNYRRIIQVGILIFELFSKFPQGMKYFYKNKILIQMSEILSQINPYSGIAAKNPILSEQNLLHTVNFGYVKFIGKLTETSNGIRLLNQWQIFQQLNNIIDSSEFSTYSNYFITLLFKSITFDGGADHQDFNMTTSTISLRLNSARVNTKGKDSVVDMGISTISNNNQLCNLLFKCLTVSNNTLKSKVVEMLPYLSIDKLFLIKLIVNNLYQSRLAERLINILHDNYFYKYNQDLNYLRLILDHNPSILILSRYAKGQMLLVNFMLLPEGFNYLSKFNYINLRFNSWLQDKSQFGILKFYENTLNYKLFPYLHFNNLDQDSSYKDYKFSLKKLLDTKEGLTYFQKFDMTTSFIDNLVNEIDTTLSKMVSPETNGSISHSRSTDEGEFKKIEESPNSVSVKEYRQLKQNLWILGEINSSNYGIQLIDLDFFNRLIEYFNDCFNWSIKGLLFYQLGKLSLNNEGLEILDELNWKFTVDLYDKFKNFSYPENLSIGVFNNQFTPNQDVVLLINKYNFLEDIKLLVNNSVSEPNGHPNGVSGISSKQIYIIELIYMFSSFLSKNEKKSAKDLMYWKKQAPQLFDMGLFLKVIKIIDNSNFSFKKRNFIFNLFIDDKGVLEELAKRRK